MRLSDIVAIVIIFVITILWAVLLYNQKNED
jgi:hypothetical protein